MAGIGEALRSTRERRGLSIDDVARETRISPRFLEALEAEQFDELPAPVYVRGFLRSYASYLKIEAQPLLDRLVGGDVTTPTTAEAYVGRQPRGGAGRPGSRRNDPFQRGGVVPAPPLPKRPNFPRPDSEGGPEGNDDWSPEPLAPFTTPHEDHGYVPGSDLMESPEYGYPQDEPEIEPRSQRRPTGVLSERPPRPNEPGVSGRVALLAGGVLAMLAFLGIAVVMTRDGGGDGDDDALAAGGLTPGITPGSVIPVGTRTTTPETAASASTATDATPSVTAAGTDATTTSDPTPGPGTPTATATSGQSPTAAPTAAPTATPTEVPATPTPAPTPIPVRPENNGFGECSATNGSRDCGSPPFRVICYTPLGYPQNQNWWVDADRSFGALPPGWKEYDGLMSNAAIINAGQSLCATP